MKVMLNGLGLLKVAVIKVPQAQQTLAFLTIGTATDHE